MKSVLISIHPKWCKRIADGSKTIEVRKTKPKLDIPFKVYIYCTKDNAGLIPSRYWWKADKTGFQHILNGKVIGEFVCNCITALKADNLIQSYYNNTQATCLTDSEIMRYANGGKLYYWHISDLVIYDKPKDISCFYRLGFASENELGDELCNYCEPTGYGERSSYGTPNGPVMCEGKFCGEAYQEYLNENFSLARPPQSWCYVSDTGANTSKGEN